MSGKKIAKIDADEIKAFREKNYVKVIAYLNDLNPNSNNMIEILNKITELDKNGFDLLNQVPENGATCAIQVKFYITAIINRAKEQCDYCVKKHVKEANRFDMNVCVCCFFVSSNQIYYFNFYSTA